MLFRSNGINSEQAYMYGSTSATYGQWDDANGNNYLPINAPDGQNMYYVVEIESPPQTIIWSTGATTNSITVSPTQTTRYYVTVTDGITTCMDSVLVTVSAVDTSLTVLDPPQICPSGGSVRLRAGVASGYQWLLNGNPIAGATARDYTAVVAGTYRVALVNGLGCRDTSRAVQITVYPTPTALGTPVRQDICSGNAIVPIILSGTVSGTIFNWTRDNTTTVTGIAASGSGNISGTLTNTTNAPVMVIFTITPTANGCTGAAVKDTVMVNPIPTAIAAPASQSICSGASINTILLNGAVAGTTYSWTRNNTVTVTGIASSGTGNISGTLTNKIGRAHV